MLLNCNMFCFLVFNELKQLQHLLQQEDNTNPKKVRGEDDDLGTFKSSKNVAKKLIQRKRKKKKNFDGECILTNITFILYFGLLLVQYLEFCYYMTADDKNGVTLYFKKKLAASKSNKYKKIIINATLEMVRSSRANARVTQLYYG